MIDDELCSPEGGSPKTKEELKERLKQEAEKPLPESFEPFRNPREYFEISRSGAMKFCPLIMVEDLMGAYRFATMRDNGEMYVYDEDEGIYTATAEALIRNLVALNLKELHHKGYADEVVYDIEVLNYVDREAFTLPSELMVVRNGILNIRTGEPKPFNPDVYALNKLPVNYDPAANCPRIRKFFSEIVTDEQDVTLLEEVIGFCLYREYFIAKALMLVGGGENGKSTWLNLVKHFLGPRNVSARGLQDIEENRFAKADLYTKMANVYADLPDRALQRTGAFKMLTGQDYIAAEKKFQNTFHFVNYAKLMFSANKVPEAMDDTDAFFRRWIIITFPNQFAADRRDPYILKKLTTDEELSGLLNIAIARLKGLLERGAFSYSKTTDELRDEYKRKSSPIASFVMDLLEVDSDAFIPKKELYNQFAQYCRELSLPCVTQDTFLKNLPQRIAVIDYRPKLRDGQRPPSLKGIRYKTVVSTVSTVSRVFFMLSSRESDFKNNGFKVEPITLDIIKIEITPDRVDTPDTEPLAETTAQNAQTTPPLCKDCGQPIQGEAHQWNFDTTLCYRCFSVRKMLRSVNP